MLPSTETIQILTLILLALGVIVPAITAIWGNIEYRRQNCILTRANQIFEAQGGEAVSAELRKLPAVSSREVRRWPLIPMAALALISWVIGVADIYERHYTIIPTLQQQLDDSQRRALRLEAESNNAHAQIAMLTQQLQYQRKQLPVLMEWGGASGCTGTVNGTPLMDYRDRYALALVCGITDQTKDRFQDSDITISPPFTIRSENIDISVPFSIGMARLVASSTATLSAEARLAQSKGINGTWQMKFWYEVILLPKDARIEDFHTLADIPRLGGIILSNLPVPPSGANRRATAIHTPMP